jgi:phospholipid/cholesterol/gamma-HCH transport system permease protein
VTDAWCETAARLRRLIAYYGGLGLLAWDVGRNAWLPRRYFGLVVAEFDGMGVRSLLLANTAAMFTGMVFALQASVYLSRFGADLYVGPLVALSLVRELGPVLTAILVGGKVGSGVTAELGSMLATEQIDALRVIGVNHVKRLIVPRVWAALLVFPLLTVLADFVGLVGGMLIAVYERQIDVYLYWNTIFYWVVIRDLLTGIGKSFFFGVIVILIGSYNGLSMTGGTEGIGRATTATVVEVSVAVIIADFFLTKLFLLL